MFEFFVSSIVTLLVVVNPVSVVPTFISLTQNNTNDIKKKIAQKACLISFIIMISFAFLGDKLLSFMKISEEAFRISGGILLMLIAIDMVIAKNSGLRSTIDEEKSEAKQSHDISVFPLAIPLISGPGALTSLIVLMQQDAMRSAFMKLGLSFIILFVILLVYICLLMSSQLIKVLGVTGTNVLTRLFGIILSAVAVQSIVSGIKIIFQGS